VQFFRNRELAKHNVCPTKDHQTHAVRRVSDIYRPPRATGKAEARQHFWFCNDVDHAVTQHAKFIHEQDQFRQAQYDTQWWGGTLGYSRD